MIFDHIEWDEHNLDHATRRIPAAQIEQALWNATSMRRSTRDANRALIRAVTDGGRHITIIVSLTPRGIRPITAWDN